MYVYIYIYIYIYIHTHTHTHIMKTDDNKREKLEQTGVSQGPHIHMCAYIHTNMHIHTYIHADTMYQTHTYIHTDIMKKNDTKREDLEHTGVLRRIHLEDMCSPETYIHHAHEYGLKLVEYEDRYANFISMVSMRLCPGLVPMQTLCMYIYIHIYTHTHTHTHYESILRISKLTGIF